MECAIGIDLSQGDDFCAFTFLFPLKNGEFGIKTRCYISSLTFSQLTLAARNKYEVFIREGSLAVFDGTILDLEEVYDDLDRHIEDNKYDIRAVGYDPYNAKDFIERWAKENGPYAIEKVRQGSRTETVPLGEIKKLSEQRLLRFDQELMSFCMGHCIIIGDTNGNRKLSKARRSEKIDSVSALLDAFVAYKAYRDNFD
jgi:phage terminase large subunit-like protein